MTRHWCDFCGVPISADFIVGVSLFNVDGPGLFRKDACQKCGKSIREAISALIQVTSCDPSERTE